MAHARMYKHLFLSSLSLNSCGVCVRVCFPLPPTLRGCSATGPVTVHICPSTHMDPGWFETVDRLYEVLFKETVTNVSAALRKNPARTYTAEITVIWAMYVGELGAAGREDLSALVAEKRLEFAGGGWVQPDEAITRFEDLVDQQTLGHLWLTSVLNHAPIRVGWSADPFGHSNTMAFLNNLNAYDAHVLGRPMSPQDPIVKDSSVVWHPLHSLKDTKGAFDPTSSTMTYDNDAYWEPYRSMNKDLNHGNIDKAADTLEHYARALASRGAEQPRNVIVILGDDAPMQPPWEHM